MLGLHKFLDSMEELEVDQFAVVSCSSLSEDSAELRYVPLYIANHPSILQVEFPGRPLRLIE